MRTLVLLLALVTLVGCNEKKGTPGTTSTPQKSGEKTSPVGGNYTGTFEVGPPPKEVKE